MGKITVSYSVRNDTGDAFEAINGVTIMLGKERHDNQQLLGKKKEIEKEELKKTISLDPKIIKIIVSMLSKAYGKNLRVVKNLTGYTLKIKEPIQRASLTEEFKKQDRYVRGRLTGTTTNEPPVEVLYSILGGLGCNNWTCGECPLHFNKTQGEDCCLTVMRKQLEKLN